MKTRKLLAGLLFAAGITGSSSVMAQVKIGTNPATIENNSNLEVEASTAGRKMKVDKSTGQLTIADGTQGQNKVLTSDANGGASWQFHTAQSTDVWVYARQTVGQNASFAVTNVIFNSEIDDRGNNYDPATGKITVPTTGIYQISCGLAKTASSASNGAFNIALGVYVNGDLHTSGYHDYWDYGGINPRASFSVTLPFNAGDIVDIRLISNYAPYPFGGGYLGFIKLSN